MDINGYQWISMDVQWMFIMDVYNGYSIDISACF